MTFFLLLIGILLLPALLILITPRLWVRAMSGWLALGLGLLIIDEHVATAAPYDDDGVFFGPGMFIGFFWVMAAGGLIAMLARWPSALTSPASCGSSAVVQWARDWAVPLSARLAAAAMHWLRNRLAGAQPAAALHVAIFGSAIAVGLAVLWLKRGHFGGWSSLERFAFAGPAFVALLVVIDTEKGFRLRAEAAEFAGDRPHCVMIYGGLQYGREASSGWELSPLVNRRYAVWAASKAPAVIVRDGDRIKGYRRINGRWDEVGFASEAPCTPRVT